MEGSVAPIDAPAQSQPTPAVLWLDLVKLAEGIRPRCEIVTVAYSSAAVLNNPGAASRRSTSITAF